MTRTDIRISGFGGQGVILCGYIIGKASAIYGAGYGTLTQAFGPEARGSACSAQVVVSDEPINYPYLKKNTVLVCMSQEAYTKFEPDLVDNGILMIDEDLVKPEKVRKKIRIYSIPATRFAEKLGRKIVLNIVMLGFFTAITELQDKNQMIESVKSSVPAGTESFNIKAFEKGYDYGVMLKKKEKK